MIIHEYPVQEVDYFAHGHCGPLDALQHPATTPRPHDRDGPAAAGVGLGGVVPPTPPPRPEIRASAAGARGGEGGAGGRGGHRLPHRSHYYYYH